MLVLEFSLPVLESCPMQTIELFLSGNIPADLVNSYLKQHAPNMQAAYLELMLAMNENSISRNLQNERVQMYLSEVLDLYAELKSQKKWDEKTCSTTRKKLLSALESISGYNPEVLLKRLPPDALQEKHAILLGKMNQRELALSIYVNKSPGIPKVGLGTTAKVKGGRSKKIAAMEGAEDTQFNPSGADGGRSDGDTEDAAGEGGSTIILDQVLDLLSRRWDRIHGAQALKLLPRDTKLQVRKPSKRDGIHELDEEIGRYLIITGCSKQASSLCAEVILSKKKPDTGSAKTSRHNPHPGQKQIKKKLTRTQAKISVQY